MCSVKLAQILVFFNFIPVKVLNETNVKFAAFSWRTLLSVLLCFGFSTLPTCISWVGNKTMKNERDGVEWLSLITFGAINYILYPILPTLLSYSLSRMPSLISTSRLKTSQSIWLIFFSFCFFSIASVLQLFDEHYKDSNTFQVFVTFLSYFFSKLLLSTSAFLITSWIWALNAMFLKETVSSSGEVVSINNCLSLYKQFDKSFGFLFFILFSSSSFLTIVDTYYVIALISSSMKTNFSYFGLVCNTAGQLTYMLAIVLGLEDLHNNLLALTDKLDEHEENIKDEKEKTKLKNLRRKILSTGPLTGSGFFNINKQSFVGMLSFAATYIVILVQFKQA